AEGPGPGCVTRRMDLAGECHAVGDHVGRRLTRTVPVIAEQQAFRGACVLDERPARAGRRIGHHPLAGAARLPWSDVERVLPLSVLGTGNGEVAVEIRRLECPRAG